MKNAFPGFTPQAIAFLRDLKKNNDREWFAPRKSIYEEQLRLPMIELVRAIHGEMLKFAPEYVSEPAKCVFRIYRDTRFAKDKTPYKTHIAASFWRNSADKNSGAGYYFSIAPEKVDIGGGLYAPEPDALLAVRERIAAHHQEFLRLCSSRAIKKYFGDLHGEGMTRVPKGFDPEHPAAELLKRKQFVFFSSVDADLALTPKLLPEIVKRFEALTPFMKFLSQSENMKARKTPVW